MLAGLSLKAAAEKLRLPFALETVYRLRRGLRQGLDRCERGSAGTIAASQRARRSLAANRGTSAGGFPGSACPPAEFQLRFQHPFLG